MDPGLRRDDNVGVVDIVPDPGISATIRAVPADAGQRVDRVLAQHLPQMSRTQVKRLLEAGLVSQAGAVLRDPSRRVQFGEEFVVALPATEDAAPVAQPIALEVCFEDAHLIVIDKPAGMVVHPAPGNADGTLVNALLAHCGASLSGIGGVRRPGIVHRLDKDTSGLIVVAKTEAAHQALSRDFAARRIERAYTAFVWGVPAAPSDEIAGNIGRSSANRKKMAVVEQGHGKPAVTRYRVERNFGIHAAQIDCRLTTGRTHQIRVHFAHRGHPLIGDTLYGTRAGRSVARNGATGARIFAFPRQALHARLLGFEHPVEQHFLRFESALPPDLRKLVGSLEQL